MEWYRDQAFDQKVKSSTSRVLTTTSGNVQVVLPDKSRYAEKLDATSSEYRCASQERPRQHCPAPKAILGSTDRRVLLRQKLNNKRLKSRMRVAQVYLNHPKFHAFKARPRKDTIKDTGEIIWDEETEAAFQNAVINIPAMGRKKKSQHGKTFGRNELIAEWIKQETGRERARKQVSSHMQTLDKLFQPKPDEGFTGIPQWGMINKSIESPVSEASEGPDFYDNSIADMVHNWRMLQVDLSQHDFDLEPALPTVFWNRTADRYQLGVMSKLQFEMWVSLPEKMEEALHRYTRTQTVLTIAAPAPLDSIPHWETSWPDLGPLLARHSDTGFELILIETSFELMLDFPPPRSKLGISLELDFGPLDPTENSTANSLSWSCFTCIYQRGHVRSRARHNQCHCPGPGKVKPPLESRWWAEQFTRLTEKRRQAVDSDDPGALVAADLDASDYLDNLSIMQQISTEPAPLGHSSGLVAVLLWSFSRATSSTGATTVWRKLVPSTDMTTKEDLISPPQMTTLPLLPSNALIEEPYGHEEESMHGFMPHAFQSALDGYDKTEGDPDEELCQDGFVLFGPHSGSHSALLPYHALSSFQAVDSSMPNEEAYHMNMLYPSHYNSGLTDGSLGTLPISLADHQNNFSHQHYSHMMETSHDSDYEDRRRALTTFDANTHKRLQTQIGNSSDTKRQIQEHNPGFEATSHHNLVAQSMVHRELDDRLLAARQNDCVQQTVDATTHSVKDEDHEMQSSYNLDSTRPSPIIVAPRAIRPPLQHHHSFAGVFTSNPSVRNDCDELSRHDFSILLDSLENHNDNFLGSGYQLILPGPVQPHDSLHGNGHGLGLGLELTRSHSQPPPIAVMQREMGYRESALDVDESHVEEEVAGTEKRYLDEETDWVDVKTKK